MKLRILSITAVLFLAFSINSQATDRNAKFIDSLGAYGMSYENGQTVGFQLSGETALGKNNRDWALIVGLGIGADSPDSGKDSDFWNGLAGLKYYFSDFTSLALVGNRMEPDSNSSRTISSASLIAKHRFIEASEGVSPFLTAGAIYRMVDHPAKSDDSELIGSVGLGVEFILAQDLAIVIEGSYIHGESLDSGDSEIGDGAQGSVSLTGYWD